MKCKNCGRENPNEALCCMYCGGKVNPTLEDGLDAYSKSENKTNSFAIISFIISILSLYGLISFYFFPSLIIAIVLGIIALVQIRNKKQKGKSLAIASIIISSILLLIIITIIIIRTNAAYAQVRMMENINDEEKLFLYILKQIIINGGY